MKYSRDAELTYVAVVRRLLAAKPDMTVVDMQKQLERNNMKFEWRYVAHLAEVARRTIRRNLKGAGKYAVLGEFANRMAELNTVAWTIVMDGTQPPKTRLAAIREARQLSRALVDMLFDSGIIERKLGTVDVKAIRESREIPTEYKDSFIRVMTAFDLIDGKEADIMRGPSAAPKAGKGWGFEELGFPKRA